MFICLHSINIKCYFSMNNWLLIVFCFLPIARSSYFREADTIETGNISARHLCCHSQNKTMVILDEARIMLNKLNKVRIMLDDLRIMLNAAMIMLDEVRITLDKVRTMSYDFRIMLDKMRIIFTE